MLTCWFSQLNEERSLEESDEVIVGIKRLDFKQEFFNCVETYTVYKRCLLFTVIAVISARFKREESVFPTVFGFVPLTRVLVFASSFFA